MLNLSFKYDYKVKDLVFLVKLFMEFCMVKFSVFDDEFEVLVILVVFVGVEEFERNVCNVVRSLNVVVWVLWVYFIFCVWMDKKYEDCFWIMKFLV